MPRQSYTYVIQIDRGATKPISNTFSAKGELVLGYNAVALPTQMVLAVLAVYPVLEPAQLWSWRWNRHAVMVARRRRY